MKPGGLFITGTCTDVGKSVVTAMLARSMCRRGLRPTAAKPLSTGSAPPGPDATLIAAAAGHAPRVFRSFPTPAAPDRSARIANESIDPQRIVSWCAALSCPRLIEGVGGWEVPLVGRWNVSDLAVALGHPVLVVARNHLGVLNHTLLTCAAIENRGLKLAGVALVSDGPDPSPLEHWNLDDLRNRLKAPVEPVPHYRTMPPPTSDEDRLLDQFWPGLGGA